MSDRDDERFVRELRPAVLHGWVEAWDRLHSYGDRCESSVQMGGWTDDDEEAYRSVIEDEIDTWDSLAHSMELRIRIHRTSPWCCDSWRCPCGDRHCDGEDCAAPRPPA